MKVLLVGTGGVGEAIASIAAKGDPKGEWLEQMILSDYNLARAKEVADRLKDKRFVAEQVDASKKEAITELAKKYKVDLVMNGCDPRFNMPIFDGAFDAGCNYMDMAMSLSQRHPEKPFELPHIKLGDLQYAKHEEWKKKGLLAVVGSGVEPGMVNVFARYAFDNMFDEIEELGVRDSDNLEVEGLDIAFGFSIWTTIEECLNPPVIWEKGKDWYCTAPFSEPEVFNFPAPVGPCQVVHVEHEEVLMLPRYFADKGVKRVTFKYGLAPDFIEVLKTIQALGLDKTEKVKVGGCEVSPRDVVGACSPDPAKIGHLLKGSVSAGLFVKGKKDGKERNVYIYQIADNQECMKNFGSQVVVAQTAFTPVIMMELMAKGIWKDAGVLGPETFPAEPYMERMEHYGFPVGMVEMESAYKAAQDLEVLKKAAK